MSHTLRLATAYAKDEEATDELGRGLATILSPGDVVGLVGELGAGKTALVRGIVAGLVNAAHEDVVASPTYTLINRYDVPEHRGIASVVHVDLYRLDDYDDLESTGYWDEIETADLLLVEWIDKIPRARPRDGLTVRISREKHGRRLDLETTSGQAAQKTPPGWQPIRS